MVDEAALWGQWWVAVRPLAAADQAREAFVALCASYSAAGRAYHTLAHIAHMLHLVAQWPEPVEDETAVQLAIWFHDVVYEPTRRDNEAQSAHYAQQVLAGWGASPLLMARVTQMILATQHGAYSGPMTPDMALLLDVDLAILGAETAVYDGYAQAIRQEYAHVPWPDYRVGRTAVLAHFLAQPHIYHTAWGRQQWEANARGNLLREMGEMGR